ncbi:hypothetical protein TSOC_009597 [Tetrabaena socialis]|uniref:Glycosyl transferase CAP10 domain-containing protein n=1 Tax=Tetrabaena socialis TaxID=47790 RepID=A0A2J7ZVH6_9CHLO|nr:hypothetical protein TSOC_009597 [Tetrabaena socialis]|eukprot:PNH04259.1 hypothetical protein TSOC_009597 [Tetrabaena socialis]
MPHTVCGMTLAFYGGVAYVVVEPRLAGLGHHVNILFTYMLVMFDLQRQYGSEIPDVEFVIASSDRPMVLTAAQAPGLVPPVMRFCSSDEHAEIKIPAVALAGPLLSPEKEARGHARCHPTAGGGWIEPACSALTAVGYLLKCDNLPILRTTASRDACGMARY